MRGRERQRHKQKQTQRDAEAEAEADTYRVWQRYGVRAGVVVVVEKHTDERNGRDKGLEEHELHGHELALVAVGRVGGVGRC